MFRKNKIKVNAILDTEIENLLKQTNQYEAIIEGKITCKNCGTTITPQNIGIILPIKNNNNEIVIEFYCERFDCTQKYTKENGNL